VVVLEVVFCVCVGLRLVVLLACVVVFVWGGLLVCCVVYCLFFFVLVFFLMVGVVGMVRCRLWVGDVLFFSLCVLFDCVFCLVGSCLWRVLVFVLGCVWCVWYVGARAVFLGRGVCCWWRLWWVLVGFGFFVWVFFDRFFGGVFG